MTNTTAVRFRAMKISCPWAETADHEHLINFLAQNAERLHISPEKAWDIYVKDRVGLVSQVAEFGRTWVLYDCPTHGDKMLYLEINSLSAN